MARLSICEENKELYKREGMFGNRDILDELRRGKLYRPFVNTITPEVGVIAMLMGQRLYYLEHIPDYAYEQM